MQPIRAQLLLLHKVVGLMTSLRIEQLCCDKLVTDHTMRLIFADDEEFQSRAADQQRLSGYAPPDTQATHQAEQPYDAALQTASYLGAKPIQPWPQPDNQQWASIFHIANRAGVLHAWLQGLALSNRVNSQHDMELLSQLLHGVSKLLASLLPGLPLH